MLTFFTDESTASDKDIGDYGTKLYGGLILSDATFNDLTHFLYDIKDRYVLPQELEIKWPFKDHWNNLIKMGIIEKDLAKQVSPETRQSFKDDHTKLKNEILEKVASSDARMVVAIRPNKLLRESTDAQIVQWPLAAVARKFERILTEEKEFGIILADELPLKIDPKALINHQYVLQLCCRGSNAVDFDRLTSIVPTINSHVSPIHQINDTVLGAIQYYLLHFARALNNPTWDSEKSKEPFRKIVGNLYSGNRHILNYGLLLYPMSRRPTKASNFIRSLEASLKNDFGII